MSAAMPLYAQVGARNNAEWRDLVCRTHGLTTHFHHAIWDSRPAIKALKGGDLAVTIGRKAFSKEDVNVSKPAPRPSGWLAARRPAGAVPLTRSQHAPSATALS